MKSINQWLDEYAQSHGNRVNKIIHFICVPLIFFTVISFFYCVRITTFDGFTLTLAHLAVAVIAIYYLMLSPSLAVGMILCSSFCVVLSGLVQDMSHGHLLWIALGIFVIAWIFQLTGHNIEGKKPSFFKDLQFLMIGPAWVMTSIYKKLGLKTEY